jgi:short-subunit dehydrogenase
LDITSDQSVSRITQWIGQEYDNKLDILVNNAGFAYHGSTFGVEEARNTLQVNYFGMLVV